MIVGVIADTHGLLRPEVFSVLDGVEHILHAGDVGPAAILTDLGALAPVSAVHGNVDGWDVRAMAPEVFQAELAGVPTAMMHGHQMLGYHELAGRFSDARLIVYGHSHIPRLDRIGGAILLNPGSAGPGRFGRPATLALLRLGEGEIEVRFVDLETGEAFYP